uniref:Predicted protein n=1 Tax=Hordeum vulgare subsp. vulgare TaxID=112509 RepID=F2EDL0_HORVV|nr:predicted protein [Hordeum vulgare subsp. vulgare]
MISSMSWVPRGAARSAPIQADPPTQEEIDEAMRTIALATQYAGNDADADDGEMEVDGADHEVDGEMEVARAKAAVGGVSDGLEELHMEEYDDERGVEPELLSTGRGDLYYASNEEDPHLVRNNDDDDGDEDDEEIEDMAIKPTDMLIVCAHNDDEFSSLQVSIVEELEDGDLNMYVHHEVPLSDFPLCTAWMDFNFTDAKKEGNFIAVGTMDPAIEIWNLDIVDAVKPHIVLGGLSKNKEKVKGEKGEKYKEGSHRSSVLGLAWNTVVRNALASASADKTVKVWDLYTGKCDRTLQNHDGKVQSVAWRSPEVLLSGSFDRSVAMTDMRNDRQSCHKWSVEADVESLVCDPHNEHTFVVSLDNRTVQAFDMRTASSHSNCGQPKFTLHAHEKAVSSVSFAPSTPNLLATGSTDNTVKLWDLSNNQPSCVVSLNPNLGAIFSVSFSNDSPFLLACGGSKGKLKVWNTLLDPAVASKFSK